MITNEHLLEQRNSHLDLLDMEKMKDTLDLHGYLPEANIIPPIYNVTRLQSGVTSESRSKPLTHFVTKSDQQWRDFRVVKPENYTHTVDLIVGNYAKILKLLKKSNSIISYSNPFNFDEQAARSGHQIAQWSKLQQSLLSQSTSRRLPYLMQIDLQSCYHTLYTHCIEWAMESVGEKNLGEKLDRSIRRGNNNHTHGLPVGHYATDIIAEIVLTWVDSLLEEALSDIECMGFRFKDNYYFLCKDLRDAQIALSIVASELRNQHFTINDSKTEIVPFVEYYSSRWQADYDYLLESLQLHDPETKFTNSKLKVFIEQVVNLSLKYKNKKSILDKGITLLTSREFEGYIDYKWLFYAVSNMLPLRTLSYPKLVAYMKKVALENNLVLKEEYERFFNNELVFAVDRRDIFALLWVSYILRDTDNDEIRLAVKSALAIFESGNPIVSDMLNFYDNATTPSLIWSNNESRLKIDFKDYMTAQELHDYLGISFGES